MASWFLPKLSAKILSLRTNFENLFAEFTTDEGHSAHPFLSAKEWKDNKSTKLLDMLDEFGKKRFEGLKEQFTLKGNENIVPGPNREEVRIVLIGKTGVGKSATGNTILGVRHFEDSYASGSVTRKSIKKFKEINGRLISVIDTPGLFDTNRSKEEIFEEIARVMKVFSKGIHAFIYVQDISSPRFTEENKKTLDFIEVNLSAIFTKAQRKLVDRMPEALTVNEKGARTVLRGTPVLQWMISKCVESPNLTYWERLQR